MYDGGLRSGQWAIGVHLLYTVSEIVMQLGIGIIWAVVLWIMFVVNMFGGGLSEADIVYIHIVSVAWSGLVNTRTSIIINNVSLA